MTDGVVVVTGGSRGIGAATVRLLARRGHAVVVNYNTRADAAEALCAEVEAGGGAAVAVRGDVSRPEDVAAIFAAADGLGRLAGLVNNAGIVDVASRVEDMSPERLTRMFAVNITGSILCAQQAIRRLSRRHGGGGGSIVNLSSAASKLGAPAYYVDYAASKGAIDTFTVGLALEVAAEGIRVNCVRPGIIDTEIHAAGGEPDRVAKVAASLPLARAGTAEEVAEAIVWLMSDAASYVTGATIPVTGGRAVFP